MKYIRFTEDKELNVCANIVLAVVGICVIAYGAGYLAGMLTALVERF